MINYFHFDLGVFLLTYVANNWFNRLRLITCPEQFIMSYGGLRGAIAFALSIMLNPDDIPSVDLMISTTLIVIIFTVFIQVIKGTAKDEE